MKNLIYLFSLCFLFSCGKDDDDNEGQIEYPLKYVYAGVEFNESRVYEVDGQDFNRIPPSSFFSMADDSLRKELDEEGIDFYFFERIELLNETEAKVFLPEEPGIYFDTIVSYVDSPDGMKLTLDQFMILEKTPDNEFLKLCIFSSFGRFVTNNGSQQGSRLNVKECLSGTDEELIQSVIPDFPVIPDTIALNNSYFLFELEK